ncbi:MAG: hypothetical protein JNM07_12635 [Phycisphaerae bacterium]|nr:hypothetical protein [Phycisphaerae bacterium]
MSKAPIRTSDAAQDFFQALEPRQMLATTFVVNSTSDVVASDGFVTLREAIQAADTDAAVNDAPAGSGTDTITFADSLRRSTIQLAAGQLSITSSLNISGLSSKGAPLNLTIRGDSSGSGNRVFNITDGNTSTTQVVNITALIITGGYLNSVNVGGAGIHNTENLTLDTVHVTNNTAVGSTPGGGISTRAGSTLTVKNSSISNNYSQNDGAGISANTGGSSPATSVVIINSTIAGNTAWGNGAGIAQSGAGTMNVQNSTIALNYANADNSGPDAGGGVRANGGQLVFTSSIVANNRLVSPGGSLDDFSISGSATVAVNASFNNLIRVAGGSGFINGNNSNIVGQDPLIPTSVRAIGRGGMLGVPLLVGSPAVNAGSNTLNLATDMRGAARASGAPDIGAFEQQSLTLVVDANGASNSDYDAGDLSLGEALALANDNALADTITFASTMTNQTIQPSSTLTITDGLTLTGPGMSKLTITGNNAQRVFSINDSTSAAIAVTISGLTVTNGWDSDFGGGAGVLNFESLTLSDVALKNASTFGGSSGEGVRNNSGGVLIMDRCWVTGNAGVGLMNFGTATVTNSTLSLNTNNGFSGAGIYTTGNLLLVNSTVSGNTSIGYGGGVFVGSGSASILNSTIANNTSDSANVGNFGGGIGVTSGTVTLTSTIVAGNVHGTSKVADDLNAAGGTFNVAGSASNLIQTAGNGGFVNNLNGNLVGVDPKLSPLASNGGPTPTHALLEGSPAVDKGVNTQALTKDQRGLVFGRAAGPIDIGAYERQILTLTVDNATDESDGNFASGDVSLREALELANANPVDDTVGFAASLNGQTLLQTLGVVTITDDVAVTGPGSGQLTISGNSVAQIFKVDDGAAASIVVGLSGLTLTKGNATDGGAISNGETLTLTDVTVTGNNATNSGGGIGNYGKLTLTNSTVSGNTTPGNGGGIVNTGTLTLTGSVVTGNSGTFGGGGIANNTGAATISSSEISANVASGGSGGGIFTAATLTVNNSTISGNSAAGFGGGIGMLMGVTVINNSTISFNRGDSNGDANGTGGGIDVGGFGGGTLTTTSTIYSNNITGSGAGTANDVTLTGGGTVAGGSANNLISAAGSAGGLANGVNGNIIGVDPKLTATLALNGATLVRSHALTPGSVALGVGSNPLALTTDQRGKARVVGGQIDIGAFEAAAPVVVSLTTDAGAAFIRGNAIILTAAGATDPDGALANVTFYFDANGNGTAEAGELVGTDTSAAGGYTATVAGAVTASWPSGNRSVLALATDAEGFTSSIATATFKVVFSTSAATGSLVRGTSNGVAGSAGADTHFVVSRNALGSIVVYTEGWAAIDLQSATGAPAATGDAVVWVDPKDRRTYVAAPSAAGLILFTFQQTGPGASTGTWSFRNLTVETGATLTLPIDKLTQFTSVFTSVGTKGGTTNSGGIVVVAGVLSNGLIVAYQQTGASGANGFTWSFVNISQDLTSQGMTTPNLKELISYVTTWDAWHLAGVDQNGRIQTVWVYPSQFKQWRTDDLTTLTNAPAIAGQLTVTLTPWSGINLAGTDASGNLQVTWWIPDFKGNWRNNDLTKEFSGPTFQGGKITGYGTPWGGMNYAGIRSNGEVMVYWWTPGPGATWRINDLTENVPASNPRPTGTLSSYFSPQGALNVFGAGSTGQAIRLSWKVPPAPNVWTIENLSSIATLT